MVVFDRDGNFLRSFGEGLFPRAHGVFMAPDDTIWLTDDGDHTVRQCTLAGKVLLTLGISGKPAPFMSGEPFHRCTHTAMSPQGDIYVSDGYGNARVHKYASNGKLLLSWGEPGSDPASSTSPTTSPAMPTVGSMWPTARTIACRCSTKTASTRRSEQLHRPCGLFMPPGKCPVCYIGELGATEPISRNVPNLGPRVTIVGPHRPADSLGSAALVPALVRPSSWRRTGWPWTAAATSMSARCRGRAGRKFLPTGPARQSPVVAQIPESG